MRNIVLRPGEPITIGDTVISAERSDLKSELRLSAPEAAFSKSTFPDLPALEDLRPLLVDILAKGVRKADIARRLSVSRASVSNAAKPSGLPWMPTYAIGSALITLHREACGGEGGDV